MSGIYQLINEIVFFFVDMAYRAFEFIFIGDNGYGWFEDTSFNIYLFSDSGWFSEPISLIQLVVLIMATFIFIFILRLLWKATKKFITMVFGVFKL